MYVQTTMAVPAGRPLLLVNADALLQSGKGTQLAVVDAGGKVHLHDVAIAVDYGGDVAISDGLAADDRVVLNPAGRLVEGVAVEVIAARGRAAPPPPEARALRRPPPAGGSGVARYFAFFGSTTGGVQLSSR